MRRMGRAAAIRSRFVEHVRSNAIAWLALVLALGGTGAYAAATIGPGDIKPDAVRSKHIKDGVVGKRDLRPGTFVSAFSFTQPPNVHDLEEVLNQYGFRVRFACGAGDTTVLASPTTDGTRVTLSRDSVDPYGAESSPVSATEESTTTDDSVVLAQTAGPDTSRGSLSVLTPSGRLTIVHFDVRRGFEGEGIPCRFWGQIITAET